MSPGAQKALNIPQEQRAIWQKCFHPSGSFIEFTGEEVEQSIPDRFERIARKYPDRIAVKTGNHVLTYAELNAMANRVARPILAEKGAPLIAALRGILEAGRSTETSHW